MPSTRSRGKPLTTYDPKLGRTLRKINNQVVPIDPIRGGLGGGVGMQPPGEVNENNKVLPNDKFGEVLTPQEPQRECLNDNARVNINIAEFDGPLVLPSLPPRHTFVVTSIFM